MNPRVEGYTVAVLESAESQGDTELATELAAFEHLVEQHGELQAALSDTAIAAAPRRAIVSELLEHKVSDSARRLAAYAASAVRAQEVMGALDWVAHRAGRGEVDLLVLGHRSARQRVGGYAAAVFEELETDQIEEMEDQLFRFARIVASNPELRGELTDRDVPVAARQDLVDRLLRGKVDPATLRLVRFVIAGGRARDFVGTVDWLVEEAATARGWRVARVRSAEPIDDAQRESLAEALSHLAGASVELQVTLDYDLLGGAVIQIGDMQVDASARGRLDRLREELLPVGSGPGADRFDRPRRDQ
ncbi:MAG: ATP synthase F1 subunit delta [Acidimicrobiales bacterium]